MSRTQEYTAERQCRGAVAWLAVASALAAVAIASCGAPEGAPLLTELHCADDHACQSAEDPFLLDLQVDFADEDGDLAAGTYSVYVDGLLTDGPHPLLGHFEEAGLSPYATEGSLFLPAGIQISGISSGMRFVVAIEVTDHAGNESNRPGMRFQLNLQ